MLEHSSLPGGPTWHCLGVRNLEAENVQVGEGKLRRRVLARFGGFDVGSWGLDARCGAGGAQVRDSAPCPRSLCGVVHGERCCVVRAAGAWGEPCVGDRSGCFSTLQAGVSAAHDGDTIAISPGAYAGGFIIDVSVKLVGAGARSTVISGGVSVGSVLMIGVHGASTEPPPLSACIGRRVVCQETRHSRVAVAGADAAPQRRCLARGLGCSGFAGRRPSAVCDCFRNLAGAPRALR